MVDHTIMMLVYDGRVKIFLIIRCKQCNFWVKYHLIIVYLNVMEFADPITLLYMFLDFSFLKRLTIL